LESAEIVADVETAGGAHAGQDAIGRCGQEAASVKGDGGSELKRISDISDRISGGGTKLKVERKPKSEEEEGL
jgi:hypothetical protein